MIIGLVFVHLLYRYGTEHMLKMPAQLSPIAWLLAPHALFLLGFLAIWRYKVFRW
jgi:Na+-transporting NADH:ubiquinone oxidoreductase subunit NqrD